MNPRHLRQAVPDADPVMHVLIVALDAPIPVEVQEADVLVLAPALNSWLRRWLSDEDAARRRAAERVAWFVDWLVGRGVHAEGRVGDGDPLQAIADALPTFPADLIVIAARPGLSNGIANEGVAGTRPVRAPRLPRRGVGPDCRVTLDRLPTRGAGKVWVAAARLWLRCSSTGSRLERRGRACGEMIGRNAFGASAGCARDRQLAGARQNHRSASCLGWAGGGSQRRARRRGFARGGRRDRS